MLQCKITRGKTRLLLSLGTHFIFLLNNLQMCRRSVVMWQEACRLHHRVRRCTPQAPLRVTHGSPLLWSWCGEAALGAAVPGLCPYLDAVWGQHPDGQGLICSSLKALWGPGDFVDIHIMTPGSPTRKCRETHGYNLDTLDLSWGLLSGCKTSCGCSKFS